MKFGVKCLVQVVMLGELGEYFIWGIVRGSGEKWKERGRERERWNEGKRKRVRMQTESHSKKL